MVATIAFATLFVLTGCGPSADLSISEQRTIISDMESRTLSELYREDSSTKKKIRESVGYAVFSTANVNLIFVSAGGGYGVATNKSTGEKTYMKMALGGVGLGLGAKDYRQVLIFHSQYTLDKFIESGWTFGGNADATAKSDESGGDVSGEGTLGDIEAFTITEAGLALQATVEGSKYWQDDDLN